MYLFVNTETKQGLMVEKPNWDGVWARRYFPEVKIDYHIDAYNIEGWTALKNLNKTAPFTSQLSGPNGAHFFIFVLPNATKEEIAAHKSYLRSQRDVTGFTVIKCDRTQHAPKSKMKLQHTKTMQIIEIILSDNAAGYRERVYLAAKMASMYTETEAINFRLVRAQYSPHKDQWQTSIGIFNVHSEACESSEGLARYGYEFTDIPAEEDPHQQ